MLPILNKLGRLMLVVGTSAVGSLGCGARVELEQDAGTSSWSTTGGSGISTVVSGYGAGGASYDGKVRHRAQVSAPSPAPRNARPQPEVFPASEQ